MIAQKLCAISVDLDEIPNYLAIHGLSTRAVTQPDAVYRLALDRMDAFAGRYDAALTLFAIGRDLETRDNASAIQQMAKRGHVVENHSYNHRYDLVRLAFHQIADEIRKGADAIERAVGRRPIGFRAPGYTVNDVVLDALQREGVVFDSSVFPCPPYYLAKAGAMLGMALRGRRSASILDTLQVLRAPTRPYRPGRHWYKRGERAMLELPIQVTPGLRLPFIGTAISVAGARGARALARQCARERFVNLELHGMDFLDAADGLEALRSHQPELRVGLSKRMAALSAALDVLRDAGYRFVRMDEAARVLAES